MYWAPEKKNTSMNTFATDVFSAGLVVYEMLSANNGPGAATFSDFVNDVSQLRADAESPGVRQELNLSIDISHAAIEEPLRELLHCTLEPDPEVRCGIGGAARLAARMLAAAKLDSDRIFKAHRLKKHFCTSQHGTAHSAEKTGKVQGSLPRNSAVPGARTVIFPDSRISKLPPIPLRDLALVSHPPLSPPAPPGAPGGTQVLPWGPLVFALGP